MLSNSQCFKYFTINVTFITTDSPITNLSPISIFIFQFKLSLNHLTIFPQNSYGCYFFNLFTDLISYFQLSTFKFNYRTHFFNFLAHLNFFTYYFSQNLINLNFSIITPNLAQLNSFFKLNLNFTFQF